MIMGQKTSNLKLQTTSFPKTFYIYSINPNHLMRFHPPYASFAHHPSLGAQPGLQTTPRISASDVTIPQTTEGNYL
jgi:hypothetical protein